VLSAIRYPLSAIRYPLSAIRYPLSAKNRVPSSDERGLRSVLCPSGGERKAEGGQLILKTTLPLALRDAIMSKADS